ncbi:MAG: hypothetical protein N2662_09540 [Bacteroidales bacterium]|nr:hypothetical protein [Bacteroidales bacterium]
MPSHKTLKSIAHNFGHSFTSLMNYHTDDYVLGHILKQARLTGYSKLSIDIKNKVAEPTELINDKIRDSISRYLDWFPKFVMDSGASMDYISKATMCITFDLSKSLPCGFDSKVLQNLYTCEVVIVDDREKEYKAVLSDWWYPET